MTVQKKELILDGGDCLTYSTEDPGKVLVHYRDSATAFGGIKRAVLKNKGKYNNLISSIIFRQLQTDGVSTSFIETGGEREQVHIKVTDIPVHVVVRNRLAGRAAELLGVEDGTAIANTVLELRYGIDSKSDPLINGSMATALGLASPGDLAKIQEKALEINTIVRALFHRAGIELIDFRAKFGKTGDGKIVFTGGITPDTSRLWDEKTGECLDKDRFRHDLSDVCASYKEVLDRLLGLENKPDNTNAKVGQI